MGCLWMFWVFFCLAAAPVLCVPPVGLQPEQVHVSYTGVPQSMIITWTTFNKTESWVEYGVWGGKLFQLTAQGSCTLFKDGGDEGRKLYMHRVTLTHLKPGTAYVYHCGSNDGWSDILFFTAIKEGSEWSPKFALFGDLGNDNPQSLARLQKETQLGMYDVILHIGDFAYDMDEDNARIGDEFMRQIQSIAAYVPYMTSPGNHENAYNFSNYRNRFSMPGDTESLWYSWNIGPAHIISLSTEVYFYLEYGLDLIFKQYSWLEKDLEEANKPENRRVRPWIITMAHRPMYCSNDDKDDCTKFESYVRVGRNDTMPVAPGLEKLFYDYGVDLELWAHEHTYERLWPVYGFQVFNGSMEHPYVNPRAPVHIITGSAGCREKHDGFIPAPRDWSAFRSTDYGYTRMQILNSTHLYLEQVSDDQNGRVIDNMWLVKEQHGTAAWK
ncbi:acid phosphatase type 7-like [Acipenser ruthenus]|uniref:acid phosphatase type 7-like n=1 Tax=Acipenser ruthenus TaxID=7906 RepID=UPI00145C18A6|nr:acid phosphatase type 7-like [Acipenser ruthenus]XP_033888037.3 acid phosphatase type 7-like [Acipenser ruthenus]XP_033888044.3 acid phosphatase type 7-like [Acipenser ruthenus]XP_033888052.3 acid phosphatase type 7-like [Acipenser ruthenus]